MLFVQGGNVRNQDQSLLPKEPLKLIVSFSHRSRWPMMWRRKLLLAPAFVSLAMAQSLGWAQDPLRLTLSASSATEQRLYALSAWRETTFFTNRERWKKNWSTSHWRSSRSTVGIDLR